MSVHDLTDGKNVIVLGGVLRFPCVATRLRVAPNPYTFDSDGITFVCPVCDFRVFCGPSNSTHSCGIASAENVAHAYTHTVQALRKARA